MAATRAGADVNGCSLVISSWFTNGYPCSIYSFYCHAHDVASPSEESLTHLDSSTLVGLSFLHCPELTMPSTLQRFPSKVGLTVFNSTIVKWSKESAFSATKHTELAIILLVCANMTRIPDGLLEPLPPKLSNIQISHSDLTELPPDLHERWHSLSTMFLEYSLLREFPKTLLSLGLRELSLQGNLIETAPALADVHHPIFWLSMNENPLKELPETLGDGTAFMFFSAEHTLLKTLPAWTKSHIQGEMFLHGTPLCATQVEVKLDGSVNLACVKRDVYAAGRVRMQKIDP